MGAKLWVDLRDISEEKQKDFVGQLDMEGMVQ